MGICLKVPALPTPAKKKSASIAHRKTVNSSGDAGVSRVAATAADAVMPTPLTKVQSAPP